MSLRGVITEAISCFNLNFGIAALALLARDDKTSMQMLLKKSDSLFLNIIQIISYLTAGAMLLGFLGNLWWIFELFSHFYHVYFLVLLILSIIFLWQKQNKILLFSLILLVISGILVFQVYLPTNNNLANSNSETLRVLSYNTNFYYGDPDKIKDDIASTKPEVVVFLELNENTFAGLSEFYKSEYPYNNFINNNQPSNIAFLSKIEFSEPELFTPENSPADFARVTLRHNNQPIALYAIHPYPPYNKDLAQNRRDYYSLMVQKAQTDSLPVLMVGDFNTTPWSPLFRKLIADSGLRDSRQGFGIQASWPTFIPGLFRIPIDQALVSDEIIIVNRFLPPSKNSDHLPLVLDIAIK